MSAEIVQAQYEALQGIAQRFASNAESTTELRAQLARCLGALQDGGWEGQGARAFTAEMEGEMLPALERLAAALAQADAVTLGIVEVLRTGEEEASRLFQGQTAAVPPKPEGGGGGLWGAIGEWVHGGLDVLGLVPGFGEVADGINGLIYLAEGRNLEAGLSFAGMIPFAGWGATGAKFALRAGREVLEEGVERGAREGVEELAERGTREAVDDPPASITVASGHKSVRDPSFLQFGDLAPNTSYTRNGYEYVTDSQGRVSQAGGQLQLDGDFPRYRDYETHVGHQGLDGDQGGHLIGNRFGGVSEGVNLVPQNGNFNTGVYNQLERSWANEIRAGNRVDVDIRLDYNGDTMRPDRYNIEYRITDPRTGEVRIEEVEFFNRPRGE